MSCMSFVSITFDKCRYRLPEFGTGRLADLSVLFGVVTQLESLILAQNERWRHA